eukprot:gene3891-4501_t
MMDISDTNNHTKKKKSTAPTTYTTSTTTTTTTNATTADSSAKEEWRPYTVIPAKLYSRPFAISRAYLDLEDAPGTLPLVANLDLFKSLFVNPLMILPELTLMHSFTFLLPVVCSMFHRHMITMRQLVALYIAFQVMTSYVSIKFVLTNHVIPIGTSLFLALELVIIIWKSHSYFIVTNYHSLHCQAEPGSGSQTLGPKFTVFGYIFDYFHFLVSPTLIYDQYSELKAIPDRNPTPFAKRLLNFAKEFYIAASIVAIVHYIQGEPVVNGIKLRYVGYISAKLTITHRMDMILLKISEIKARAILKN